MATISELSKALNIGTTEAMKIDKGMWDILIELNRKGYKTVCCCEGHTDRERAWNAYLLFAKGCVPNVLPPLYYIYQKGEQRTVKRHSEIRDKAFYWYGTKSKKYTIEMSEQERRELLSDLLKWAKELEPWSCGKVTV